MSTIRRTVVAAGAVALAVATSLGAAAPAGAMATTGSAGGAPASAGSAATAAPHSVSPGVHRRPLAGVDAAALSTTPPAFDPSAVSRQAPASTAPMGRASVKQRPTVFTPPLDLPAFGAAGVSWSDTSGRAADLVVQVRIREHGGWSEWQDLGVADGADPGSADSRAAGSRIATEPITSASADGLQVRVDSPSGAAPTGLELVTVDRATSTADAQAGDAAAQAGTAGRPAIVTRAQWGADESLRTCTASYSSTIKAGLVHHTVNSNSYTKADSAALVRSIYAYHVNGNGWCDMGYNFLVDRYGQIFEGRAGGVDRPVVGAQAGGFNTNTFGVSGIGDFTTATPASAMLAAYAAVIGWKLSLHGVDPQVKTVLISGGGPYTPYPAGTAVTVRTTSGHRDVDSTDCPGDAFYPQLTTLGTQAARYLTTSSPASLTLSAGQTLDSPDGRYRLAMQVDGNLVVYGPSGAVWAAGSTMPASYFVVQGDGNAVVYDRTDGSPRWASNTSGTSSHLEMQNDGNLVLYAGSGAVLWDTKGYARHPTVMFDPTKTFVMALAPGQVATSPNQGYRLAMQPDGNLVEYGATGPALWATATFVAGSRLVQQGDGNLVVYSPENRPVWSSATFDNPGAFTVLTDLGKVTLYRMDGTVLLTT